MSKLYSLCGGQLIGVMFGSVNNSAWENCKTLLLPYLIWGLIELLSLSPSMRRFTAAKTLSLYFLGSFYLVSGFLIKNEILLKAISVALALLLSFLLYRSKFPIEGIFAPSVFLLFLFWAFYFSFTPFPPKLMIFRDPETGLSGIIPNHIVWW